MYLGSQEVMAQILGSLPSLQAGFWVFAFSVVQPDHYKHLGTEMPQAVCKKRTVWLDMAEQDRLYLESWVYRLLVQETEAQLQAVVCEWTKVWDQDRGLWARFVAGQWPKATGLCVLGYPWDSHVLTLVLRSPCCFLIIKHWLANINVGHSYQCLCYINSYDLTPQILQ